MSGLEPECHRLVREEIEKESSDNELGLSSYAKRRIARGDDDEMVSRCVDVVLCPSGTRNSGDILLYDVRQKDCIVKFQSHRQEVCGLKWCPNGRYLASGSNDNTVCVWDFHQCYSSSGTSASLSSLLPPADGEGKKSNYRTKPLWHFKDHKAAVKVTCGKCYSRPALHASVS